MVSCGNLRSPAVSSAVFRWTLSIQFCFRCYWEKMRRREETEGRKMKRNAREKTGTSYSSSSSFVHRFFHWCVCVCTPSVILTCDFFHFYYEYRPIALNYPNNVLIAFVVRCTSYYKLRNYNYYWRKFQELLYCPTYWKHNIILHRRLLAVDFVASWSYSKNRYN